MGRLTSYFLTREKRDRLKKVAQPSIAYALFVYTCTPGNAFETREQHLFQQISVGLFCAIAAAHLLLSTLFS